ncbi:MAG: GT2 family glycosyltransferase [Chlamydiales bacterium]|jgi:GT2 family glycosyltransferase
MSGKGETPERVPAEDLWVEATAEVSSEELPHCAVVILNWNGRHHLDGCFDSLAALDYPPERLEVVLVDNGSTDGSVEHMRAKHDWVHLIQNPRNMGFSAGCNQGAGAASSPELLCFLNNDMRVEPDFLKRLVAPIVRGVCEATTGRILSWDGKLLNSVGGGMNFHGIGIQRGYLEQMTAEYERPCLTLFACGGAMAMRADVFEQLGGFDEDFFAYYEDVDLGWRTWVAGHSIRYVPEAICYHHHSSTSQRVAPERLRVLQVRNPLLACFKNYGDERLKQILPAMLALATRRAYLSAEVRDPDAYRIESLSAPGLSAKKGLWERIMRRLGRRPAGTEAIGRVALADLVGINDLLGQWDFWMEKRVKIQASRRRSDEEIFRLFLRPLWCIEDDYGYKELQAGLTHFLGLDELFEGATRMHQDPKS